MDENNPFKLFFEPNEKTNHGTKELKMKNTCMRRYRNILKSFRISPYEFSKLYKDSTKKENAPEGSNPKGVATKEDFEVLLQFLYESTGSGDTAKSRFISKRAGYKEKDEIYTYFAIEYPDNMRALKELFYSEEACPKIFNRETLVKKWNEYIDKIQLQLQNKKSSNTNQEEHTASETIKNTQYNDQPNSAVSENYQTLGTDQINMFNPQNPNQIRQENETHLNFNHTTNIQNVTIQIPMPNITDNIPRSQFVPTSFGIYKSPNTDHEIYSETFSNQPHWFSYPIINENSIPTNSASFSSSPVEFPLYIVPDDSIRLNDEIFPDDQIHTYLDLTENEYENDTGQAYSDSDWNISIFQYLNH